MSLRGNTAPPDGCPRGRSTAPAGCAAGSRMMNPRSGIGERPWMPPSSCWKSCNFSHEKTLPGRDWQTLAAPGQEAFLTPYLTTVRTGTPGNSGFKSAKKYLIPSVKRRKALQITIKNLVQAFGSKMPSIRIAPLGPDVLWDPGFQREASFRMEGTGPDAAAARILAVFPGRCIIKNSGRRPAAGGWISASEGGDPRWSAYTFRCGDQLAGMGKY